MLTVPAYPLHRAACLETFKNQKPHKWESQMASSNPTRCFHCGSVPNPNKPKFPISVLSCSSLSTFCGFKYDGLPVYGTRAPSSSTTYAKFEKFQGKEPPLGKPEYITSSQQLPQITKDTEEREEDDSCLPSNLEGAVRQSSQASAAFLSSGGMRAIVELLIPQLQFLDDEGAQGELWEISRTYLDTLIQETGCQRIKAIFPDTGAAALLQYRWKDATFGFSSLMDRKPVGSEDEIVVMIMPDYQMLEYVERIASNLSDDLLRPLIMWQPRLISEDVGVGFNVRKLRRYFLSSFTIVYSMRPLPSGAVFRCYPGLWKVFYDDKDRLGRYLLAKEQTSRPDAGEIEMIFGGVEDDAGKGPSLFTTVAGIFSSLNRFMKAISR